MKLSYFPQIKAVHTSKIFHGQIYIPFANWLLMVGTIIVTAVYNNVSHGQVSSKQGETDWRTKTTRLGNAYGVCVVLVTFITTCMVSIVALLIWRINPFIVLFVFLVFAALDGAYMSAALTKVPEGAWFTLVLAIVLASIFILWRFGKEQQWEAEAEDRFQPSNLICKDEDGKLHLTAAFGGSPITTIKGMSFSTRQSSVSHAC